MIVFILENVPTGLRGELTRWLLEPRAGVFIGNVSALVRDLLWEEICQRTKDGSAVLVHSAQGEQGFAIRTSGTRRREMVDWEGMSLVRMNAAKP